MRLHTDGAMRLAGAITFDLALPVIRRARDANLHLARSDAAQKLKVSPHHVALTAKAATAGNDYQCNPGGVFEPELRVAV